MPRSTGTYLVSTALGEPVRAFVPHPLPPSAPALNPATWACLNEATLMALQRLSAVAGLVDLLDKEAGLTIRNADDVEEVGNCLQAFEWVQDQLRSPRGLPLSVRMLNEAHRRLMDGARGSRKQPGELRRSQNWIGGTRPGHSVCVPLPPDQVPGLLANLERFIHAQPSDLPALVRVALVQSE